MIIDRLVWFFFYITGVFVGNAATIVSLSGLFLFVLTGSARYLIVTIALAVFVLSIKIENDV